MSSWLMWARVRVLADVQVGNVDPGSAQTYRAGEEVDMILRGRAGEPLSEASFWSNTDVDGAYILQADQVEVLDVLGPYWSRCGSCGAAGRMERGEDEILHLKDQRSGRS